MNIRTGDRPSEDEPVESEPNATVGSIETTTGITSRYLLGWLPDPIALMAVLGRPATPGEDTAAASAVVAAARAARSAREPWVSTDPRVSVEEAALREIAERNDIQAAFASMTWEPSFVDLTKLLSVQQLVNMHDLDARTEASESGPDGLMALCLPKPGPENLEASVDGDGIGITLSSANPNLRITGLAFGEVIVGPADKRQAVQVFVGIARSYVQVAEYRGRFFLRDGYHRAVGLLRRGKRVVPAILIRARTQSEVTPVSGLFGEDVLFDDRPPGLVDFLDEAVAYTGPRRIPRKFIRVRGDQFAH